MSIGVKIKVSILLHKYRNSSKVSTDCKRTVEYTFVVTGGLESRNRWVTISWNTMDNTQCTMEYLFMYDKVKANSSA